MKRMSVVRYMAAAAVLCLASPALGAEVAAVFAEVTGKVEYQKPGGAWKPAKAGDGVERGTIVSTGFKSSATLKLDEASLFLKPLTRLTLEELVKTSGGTQTKLFLLAGRVKADVPPQAGKTNDFKVRSPTATASVRGTAFEFDGQSLLVSRGKVQYLTPTSQFRIVGAQEFAYIAPNGTVTPPAPVSEGSDLGDAPRIIEQEGAEGFEPPPAPPPEVPNKGSTVTITVR